MPLRTYLMTAAFALGGMLAATAADAGSGTRGEAASEDAPLVEVAYPVADLVVPLVGAGARKPVATGELRLMNLLQATVRPGSWLGSGGAGSMQFYPLGMSLVVRQTAETQAEVDAVLKALHRLQEVTVAVELRLVTLSTAMAGRFRAKAEFAPGAKALPTAFLTTKELYPWMELFQTDPATSVMQAPKISMINGQPATLSVGEKECYVAAYKVVSDGEKVNVVPQPKVIDLGTKFSLRPVVSADRRFVRLELDFRHTTRTGEASGSMPIQVSGDGEEEQTVTHPIQLPMLQTLAVKQACAIADGQTMVISVGELLADTRTESAAPPVVNRIPYLNRLFRNVGYAREVREMFLLVTPRIIVMEEEELRSTSVVPRR